MRKIYSAVFYTFLFSSKVWASAYGFFCAPAEGNKSYLTVSFMRTDREFQDLDSTLKVGGSLRVEDRFDEAFHENTGPKARVTVIPLSIDNVAYKKIIVETSTMKLTSLFFEPRRPEGSPVFSFGGHVEILLKKSGETMAWPCRFEN